ncbi:hypothetical protein CNX65_00620 [Actinosynnema pretiosum]|uniref:Uncharacterized protein n=1 Tax=Actinosynnema pretiosum TaxID=42197 RepID=A0A290YZ16_9PSEU|nr:hypothetical protein CNX65_00620 [Actinosynnema pretiosum]
MSTSSEIDSTALGDEPESTTARASRWGRLRELATSWEAPSRAVLSFSALLTLVFWNLPAFTPNQPKGDYDYGLLIYLARQTGLSFGTEISTTYGPLYFLAIPNVLHRGEVLVGYLLWFGFATAATAAVHQALARTVGRNLAWLAVGVMALSSSFVPLTVVITSTFAFVVVLSLFFVREELPRWADRAYPIAMGLLVAAMLLTKFSVGLMCGPVILGAVLAREGAVLRRFLEYAISGIAGLIGFWLLAGQPPLEVVDYVVRALSVGSGHAQSMGLEIPGNVWEYVLAAPMVVVLVVALVTTDAGKRRWLFYLGTALGTFLLLKQGFVRHDSHSAQFFSVAAGFSLVVALLRRSSVLASTAVVALLAQAFSFGGGLSSSIDPSRSLKMFGEGMSVVASGGQRDRIVADARADLLNRMQLPERYVERIGDAKMRTAPFDFAMGWTYGMTVDILPTLLDYGAYTELLDEMNEEWVVDDARAPEFIVREDTRITLDNRFPLWDSPRVNLAQACRYELVDSDVRWQLLQRIENRCGEEKPLGEVTAGAHESIPVPTSDEGLVIARFHPEQSILDKLKSTAFRSGEYWITLDGEPHRLPLSHAEAPILISAPGDDSLVLGGRELDTKNITANIPGRVVFSVVTTK